MAARQAARKAIMPVTVSRTQSDGRVAIAGTAVAVGAGTVAIPAGDSIGCTGLTWIMGVPASALETREVAGIYPVRLDTSSTNAASEMNFPNIETSSKSSLEYRTQRIVSYFVIYRDTREWEALPLERCDWV